MSDDKKSFYKRDQRLTSLFTKETSVWHIVMLGGASLSLVHFCSLKFPFFLSFDLMPQPELPCKRALRKQYSFYKRDPRLTHHDMRESRLSTSYQLLLCFLLTWCPGKGSLAKEPYVKMVLSTKETYTRHIVMRPMHIKETLYARMPPCPLIFFFLPVPFSFLFFSCLSRSLFWFFLACPVLFFVFFLPVLFSFFFLFPVTWCAQQGSLAKEPDIKTFCSTKETH